jgi:hypothetical protein
MLAMKPEAMAPDLAPDPVSRGTVLRTAFLIQFVILAAVFSVDFPNGLGTALLLSFAMIDIATLFFFSRMRFSTSVLARTLLYILQVLILIGCAFIIRLSRGN